MTFLSPEYKTPKSASGYMKFKDGTNKFRILSPLLLLGMNIGTIKTNQCAKKSHLTHSQKTLILMTMGCQLVLNTFGVLFLQLQRKDGSDS